MNTKNIFLCIAKMCNQKCHECQSVMRLAQKGAIEAINRYFMTLMTLMTLLNVG